MTDTSVTKTKSVTVAELRNNSRRVSASLENGESVEIIKCGRPFAQLSPAAVAPSEPGKIDFADQLRGIWGQKVFTAAEVQVMREAELGGLS